jgi:subtilisin family serine protease
VCDTIPGELLISFHQADVAAKLLMEQLQMRSISNVQVTEDLGTRLLQVGLKIRPNIEIEFHRLKVPEGEEDFSINHLQFHYKRAVINELDHGRLDRRVHRHILELPQNHFQAVPNSILSVRQPHPPGLGFTFTQIHQDYKKIIGGDLSKVANSVVPKTILVMDTGLDPASNITPIDSRNFVDVAKGNDVADDHGHGTAVAEVIHDLCPSATFVIFKVADQSGRASEWDVMAALAARTGHDMVNMSLAFGLPDQKCPHCGRESHSSRSAVFENLIHQIDKEANGPLLVAAAGNESKNQLSFPARYDKVVAVESINKSMGLSGFTNRAALDNVGNNHKNVFVLPGGEKLTTSAASEYIGTSSIGGQFYGTSFAAAYASGLIAAIWADASHSSKNRDQILSHLRNKANQSLTGYQFSTHGNGMMQFC